MATFTAFVPIDVSAIGVSSGDVKVFTPELIRIEGGGNVFEYRGTGFLADQLGNLIGGTLNSIDAFAAGVPQYQITGLSHSMVTFNAYLLTNDMQGALGYIGNGNDVFIGSSGADVGMAYAGNDTLDGGAGADTAYGGAGDDTYIVNDPGDDAVEQPGQGNDTVLSSISYRLDLGGRLDVENLTLTGSAGSNATGNQLANVIAGNPGNNTLQGLNGDDTLIGGAGNDSANYNDPLASTGIAANLATGQVIDSWANTDTLESIETISGTPFADSFTGGDPEHSFAVVTNAFESFNGGAGNDTITGGGSDFVTQAQYSGAAGAVNVNLATGTGEDGLGGTDSLIGVAAVSGSGFSDILTGGGSAFVRPNGTKIEYFTGGPGNDAIDGGNGQDRASYSNSPNPVVVDLQAGTAFDGYDSDPGAPGVQPYTDTLISVERALGSGWNDALLGSDRTDTSEMFDGMAGNDSIDGRGGFDYVSFQSGTNGAVVDLSTGEATNDGWGGADTLDGIEGVIGSRLDDSITGGAGNESFDGSFGNDTIDGGAGTDRALYENASSAVTVNLATGVASDGLGGADALSNIEEVSGSIHNDSLTGNAAANRLDGGAGNDSMAGGGGNDTYVVDSAGDVVTEFAAAGADTVRSSVSYALANVNLENLVLLGGAAINGTGNGLANVITGNDAVNTLVGGIGNDTLQGAGGSDSLDGGAGADSMLGGAGDDAYSVNDAGDAVSEFAGAGADTVRSSVSYALANVNLENLVLIGNATINATGNGLANLLSGNNANNLLTGGNGNDTLEGSGGSDTMLGGGGADSMVGGIGADVYVVDAGDVVVELEADAGFDQVNSAASYVLPDNVEGLVLTGAAAVNATGNALANILNGNSAANLLDGSAGADTMKGWAGDDSYVVDHAGDFIIEGLNSGLDSVASSVTYTLRNNLENLTLTGGNNLNGTGNGLANVLTGNAANNFLTGGVGNDSLDGAAGNDNLKGGLGHDVLTGGSGADNFFFAEAPGAANSDVITDFASGADRLRLDDAFFAAIDALGIFALNDARFFAGAGATGGDDASDRVVYDTGTGNLYYDSDGSGLGAAQLIAMLDGAPTLAAQDIVVI